MTSEEEKQLILLSAIIRIGGSGTKNTVLNEVEHAKMMKLSSIDLEPMKSRNEVKWRNDLAYARKHLVTAGFISNIAWNTWQITDSGKVRHALLAKNALKETAFRHIAPESLPSISQSLPFELSDENALTGETGIEGAESQHWITRYERDPKLRAAAIKLHGAACMGCGFNFEKIYGSLGLGFIEVHHTKPISFFGGPSAIDPATDLVVLCSNCHSIVHRRRQSPLSLAELRKTISETWKNMISNS